MDNLIDLYRQAKAAQRRAEQGGFLDTAAALARIADMIAGPVAQEASMDQGGTLPFAPGAGATSARALPINRQARR